MDKKECCQCLGGCDGTGPHDLCDKHKAEANEMKGDLIQGLKKLFDKQFGFNPRDTFIQVERNERPKRNIESTEIRMLNDMKRTMTEVREYVIRGEQEIARMKIQSSGLTAKVNLLENEIRTLVAAAQLTMSKPKITPGIIRKPVRRKK